MSDDRCVCCGKKIPEGRQVCPACERFMDDKGIMFNPNRPDYIDDWAIPIGLVAVVVLIGWLIYQSVGW